MMMCFFCFFTLTALAEENLSEEQIVHLKELGFTDEEISFMKDEEIQANLLVTGKLVSSDTKYFRVIEPILDTNVKTETMKYNSTSPSIEPIVSEIDEATYWDEVNSLLNKDNNTMKEPTYSTLSTGSHVTSYKTLTTTISTISSSKYRVKTSVKWHIMPSNRKIDVIGTSINSSFWAPDSGTQYGQQNWTKNYNCNLPKTNHSATYGSSSTKWAKGASGYTLSIDLPNNVSTSYACTVERVEALSGYSYYTASKLAATSRIDAYGKYLHQETSITITPSIMFYPASFGVSVNQSNKFTSSSTHATLNF